MDEDAHPEPVSKGKKTRSRKRVAITVFLLILITASLILFYDLNGHSLDPRDREIRLIITGSMEGEMTDYPIPTIEKNSVVMVRFISEDEKKDIQVGDVIQFNYHGILNHHRVVSNDSENGYVITKGDNTEKEDGKIPYEKIRGEVVGKNHILGEIFMLVKTYIYVLVTFLVALYIGVLLLEEIRREKEEKK